MQYTSLILRSITIMLFLLFAPASHCSTLGFQQTTNQYSQLHEQGLIYLNQNSYPEALQRLNQALKEATQTQNIEAQASVQLSLARLHYKIHNFDYAALQVHNAIELLRSENASDLIAEAQTLLGLIYTENGKWEEAEIFLHMADQYYSSQGFSEGRAQVLLGYGALSIKQKQFSEAINYLESAKVSLNNQQQVPDLAITELLLAEAYIKIDPELLPTALNKARTALTQALELGNQVNLTRIRIEGLRLQSYLALRANKFNEAEDLLMTYEQKSDSLHQKYLVTIAQTGVDDQDLASLNQIIDQQKSDLDRQQRSISFSKITTKTKNFR